MLRNSLGVLRQVTGVLATSAAITIAAPALAATYTPAEQANMKAVVDFYAALESADATHSMTQRARSIVETYIHPDYIQHAKGFDTPGPGTARDKLIAGFEAAGKNPPPPGMMSPARNEQVMANGDRVILVTSRQMPGGTSRTYIFNMFRLKDGKLIEHWDGSTGMGGAPGGGAPGGPPPGAPAGGPPAGIDPPARG